MKKGSNDPILSILVPTYNYAQGVDRILQALTPLPELVELIFLDDSSTDDVERIFHTGVEAGVTYRRNAPARGAIQNWNNLLDGARGQFVMLLHHDEVPLGPNFLRRLLAVLRDTSEDVLMMDVLLLNEALAPTRKHVPRALRDFVIHYIPGYLFCRNVIGPTGSLVVRKALYPTFDTTLKWLVDVELYYRLRQNTKGWKTLREFEVGSVQGDHETITNSIQSQLKDLEQTERARLRAAHPDAAFWINLPGNPLIGTLEAAVWVGFRTLQLVLSMLRTQKDPNE